MKKGKDRNYGKGKKGRGERISGKSVKIIKEIFMFVFQFLLYEKNIYLNFCTFHYFLRQNP